MMANTNALKNRGNPTMSKPYTAHLSHENRLHALELRLALLEAEIHAIAAILRDLQAR